MISLRSGVKIIQMENYKKQIQKQNKSLKDQFLKLLKAIKDQSYLKAELRMKMMLSIFMIKLGLRTFLSENHF